MRATAPRAVEKLFSDLCNEERPVGRMSTVRGEAEPEEGGYQLNRTGKRAWVDSPIRIAWREKFAKMQVYSQVIAMAQGAMYCLSNRGAADYCKKLHEYKQWAIAAFQNELLKDDQAQCTPVNPFQLRSLEAPRFGSESSAGLTTKRPGT